MNNNNFNIETIEDLLIRSKQLQNKIRQELGLEEPESPVIAGFREQLSPQVWDNTMLKPYVQSNVTNYLQDKSTSSTKLKRVIPKLNPQKVPKKTSNGIDSRESLLNLRSSSSVGTQVAGKPTNKIKSRVRVPFNRIKNSNVNESSINGSKVNLESNKLLATSSHRLPLQRFAESSNKRIDFFHEHPDLEFDMTSEHTTLFPRRFHRTSECLSQNGESVNVVEAEVKPPQTVPDVVKQDTWNGILMQNKPNNKPAHKIVRLKKNKEVILERTPNCLDFPNQSPTKESDEGYDVITSIPSKGTFALEKKSELLAKQKKCHLQRFPVLYIRPECQVQKLTSISINGEKERILRATNGQDPLKNVRYFEFRHRNEGEDGEKSLGLEIIPDVVKIDLKQKDDSNEGNKTKENKFFKALEIENVYEGSLTNSVSSPFTCQSSSLNQSFSSLSSSSSLNNVNKSKSAKEIHRSSQSPSEKLQTTRTKDSVKRPPSRREAHVQTENQYKETVSTNTSPLHNLTQSPPHSEVSTSTKLNDRLNKTGRPYNVENSVEDDIIVKIFERIRDDLPNVLEIYKNRTTSTPIDITTIMPVPPLDQECNQKHEGQQHQIESSAWKHESNVKLLPNEYEPELTVSDKVQGQNNQKHTIQEIVPIECYNDSVTLDPGSYNSLQQNPVFVQSIKANAVYDVMSDTNRKTQERHENPSDVEIKRAVKIFIDSLALNGCAGEKQTIINETSAQSRSRNLLKFELISNNKHNKYTSSESSAISSSLNRINKQVTNAMKMKNVARWCDISGSTISADLFSTDLESEGDANNDMMDNLSLRTNDKSSMSEGEVKSIGQI